MGVITYTDLLMAADEYEPAQQPVPFNIPSGPQTRFPHRPRRNIPPYRPRRTAPIVRPNVQWRDSLGRRWLFSRALGKLFGIAGILIPSPLGYSQLDPSIFYHNWWTDFFRNWSTIRQGYDFTFTPNQTYLGSTDIREKRVHNRQSAGYIGLAAAGGVAGVSGYIGDFSVDGSAIGFLAPDDMLFAVDEFGLTPEVSDTPRHLTESPAGWMGFFQIMLPPNFITNPSIPIRPVQARILDEYPGGALVNLASPNIAPAPILSPGWYYGVWVDYWYDRLNDVSNNMAEHASWELKVKGLADWYEAAWNLWRYYGIGEPLSKYPDVARNVYTGISLTTLQFTKLHQKTNFWQATRTSRPGPNKPMNDRKVRSTIGVILNVYDMASEVGDVIEAAAQAVVLDFENGPDRSASKAWRNFLDIVARDGLAAGIDYLGGIRGVVSANPFRIGYNILMNELEDRIYGLGGALAPGTVGELNQLLGIMNKYGIGPGGLQTMSSRNAAKLAREFNKRSDQLSDIIFGQLPTEEW